jgi:serine/threonine protein kinase/Tol biopolymer transport system component
MIGRRLSHFRVIARIGEGGMGVVYKAEDEKLRRLVAIKVLPPESVADEERRLRFLREAHAAASLTHPNIATIHEVDEIDGVVFIAMEYIEGKTLRSFLSGRPLEVGESLRIAVQIAEGLAKAHQKRIVHRDLKPENVMVTSEGHVKILDFGLAKLLEPERALTPEEASRLQTISGDMTRQGKILGTAAYMSPEQARGQGLDHRSDLFSFGIVLYEMVTGRVPFRGATPMDTLSAILRSPLAPAVLLNADIPAEMDRILGKCLEKDPAERFQDTRDLVVDLKRLKRDTDSQPIQRPVSGLFGVPVSSSPSGAGEVSDSPSARTASSPSTPKTSPSGTVSQPGGGHTISELPPGPDILPAQRDRRKPLVALVAICMAALAGFIWVGRRFWSISPSPQPTRELRQREILSGTESVVNDAALSPDGRYLAIAKDSGLTIRLLETGEDSPVSMPAGILVRGAAWSHDGTKLFIATKNSAGERALASVSLVTRIPRTIRTGNCGWPIPSPDGRFLSFMTFNGPGELWVMESQGGSERRLFAPAEGEWLTGVTWSPDSRKIAYALSRVDPDKGFTGIIESVDVTGGSATRILQDTRLPVAYGASSGLQWLPDGRLLFPMTEPPPNFLDANLWSLRVSPATGLPEGKPERITRWNDGRPAPMGATADGKLLLVARDQAQSDVWIGELEEGGTRLKAPRRLTLDRHHDSPSFWMPDGRRIVFSSNRYGSADLLVQDIDGGDPMPLITGPGETSIAVLAPSRHSVLFAESPFGDARRETFALKRAELAGGSTKTVLEKVVWGSFVDCPTDSSASCLLSENQGKEAVFYDFDPEKGKGKQVARISFANAAWLNWALSPGGDRIGYLQESDSGFLIKILSLADGHTREIALKGLKNVQSISWGADDNSLLASNFDNLKSSIFRIDLQGAVQVLLQSGQDGEWLGNARPSLDGRHLAFQKINFVSDYWLLEGF